MSRHAVVFSARPVPLPACAVLALGDDARALARRLRDRSDAELALLEGVAHAQLIALIGEPEQLPWCPGARYFGSEAPALYVPIALRPSVPGTWLRKALPGAGPLMVWPNAGPEAGLSVVPLIDARPVDRARLHEAFP